MAEITNSTQPTYDYSMIGSIGGEAAESVNGEMINKMRAAEEESLIDPITEDIDHLTIESEKLDEIKTKITEFQGIVDYFDMFSDDNVFNQYLFDTSGDSAVFDAVDMTALEEGTTTVNITQLAQKDVYQSNMITGIESSDSISQGQTIGENLSIEISTGETYEFTMYNLNDDGDAIESAKTYDELINEINAVEELSASLEEVGSDNGDPIYRLVIKSAETGEDNALTITQNGVDFGFGNMTSSSIDNWGETLGEGSLKINGELVIDNTDGKTYEQILSLIDDHADFVAVKDGDTIKISAADGSEIVIEETGDNNFDFADGSQALVAQNLNATIDGIDYDVSSSSLTTQGSLKITGLSLGESSITVSKDTSAVLLAAEAMVTQYNELTEMLNEEIYSSEPAVEDTSMLKTILSDIKNMLFQNYGADTPEYGDTEDEYGDIVKAHSNVTNNDKNLFMFGFELDENGTLSVDSDTMTDIINGENDYYDFDDLQSVFTGDYANKGVGVQIMDYLDALDGYNGTFYNYDLEMIEKEEELTEDKEEELERLDAKYSIIAEQYASYSAIIASMESAFSGVEMMIAMETSDS
ncbi:MAG: flagellar cap protein FliD N-terminal domain-containing protein [Campylobacterota bacterium]|nr:flagellar cap protein FliD N-terminal domain-containing protein [Campylobacterota bacterium]